MRDPYMQRRRRMEEGRKRAEREDRTAAGLWFFLAMCYLFLAWNLLK